MLTQSNPILSEAYFQAVESLIYGSVISPRPAIPHKEKTPFFFMGKLILNMIS